MNSFEKINAPHEIKIGISPSVADIAIVSTDENGNIGSLNSYVLREYGYSEDDMPKAERLIPHGFSSAIAENKKSILFVVTVSGEDTKINLEKNLYNTLQEFGGWIAGRKVWIPLMGTGTGGLSIEESYRITVKTINRFLAQNSGFTVELPYSFIISFPERNEDAKILFNTIDNYSDAIENDVSSIIKSYKGKFYLVGANWSGEDKVEEFIREGFWQTGYEERFNSLINNISINSILIIKSTYATRETGYLRVKAIGVVVENPNDGTSLKVDWKIAGLSIDIEELSSYRNTIQEIATDDVVIVFSRISRSIWYEIFKNEDKIQYKRKDHIASLLSDTDGGPDYLDISADVNAFAKVMAARTFTPPLAIALFGKWGSGKSFFMRKLRDRITTLSAPKSHKSYCKGIAQIHFNAWSYMDANLWASIVTRIFEGLNDYIKQNVSSDREKINAEEQLNKQLNISKEHIDLLEKQKAKIEDTLKNLKKQKDDINQNIADKIKEIETKTLWATLKAVDKQFHVKDQVEQALKDNKDINIAAYELKEIVPEKYWENPGAAYEHSKSIVTFIKEFFKRDKIGTNILWLSGIVLLIACIPVILWGLGYNIRRINFTIPQSVLSIGIIVGAIWRRAETTYKKLQPVIFSFWKVKMNYEKQIEEAKAKFEQEGKALKFEIEKNNVELISIDTQIIENNNAKTELEFKLRQALSTEALYTFVENRSNSEDYRKHLGIISLIRKDFDILNSLFIGHNTELSNIKPEDVAKFKGYFKTPLERIVLYIDDLDRCPEETVVQVLEAVNLLMAFPLFIVVVGVDPRWVKNALIKKHYLQFSGKINGYDETDVERIEPTNYLEKIFQIPFCLKSAGDDGVKNMIRKLAEQDLAAVTNTNTQAKGDANTSQAATTTQQNNRNQEASDKDSSTNTKQNPTQQPALDLTEDNPETIRLTDKEVELLEDMSVIVGDNPRAIKRLVNTYRVIKAHEDYNYDVATNEREVLIAMFLLALPIGKFRELYPSFQEYITAFDNDAKPLTFYLQSSYSVDNLNDKKNLLYVEMSGKKSYHTLGNIGVKDFETHNSFIKRFTFNN